MDQNEKSFFFKNVFNAHNSLSRWVLKLSMVRNDLFYAHSRLQLDTEIPFRQGESLYFFRLGVSHYREALKLIDFFNNDGKVLDFVNQLSEQSKDSYRQIIDLCAPFKDPNSFIQKYIKPIRDNSFHYYSKESEKEFIERLDNLDDFYTRLTWTSHKRRDVDFVFSDEAAFYLIFGDIEESEFRMMIQQISELMSSIISFVDEAVGRYLFIKNQHMKNIRHINISARNP